MLSDWLIVGNGWMYLSECGELMERETCNNQRGYSWVAYQITTA